VGAVIRTAAADDARAELEKAIRKLPRAGSNFALAN
jgi:hypothetical protein